MVADRFLRLPAVVDTIGVSVPTVYRMIKAGAFPAPTKLGRISLWPESKVQAWVQAQAAA
jgi:prophage regulatory protein